MTAGSPSCGKCGRTRGACKAAWQHSAARAELPHRHRPRHHRCRHDVGTIMASAARRRPGSSPRHRSFAPSFLPSRSGGTAGQCRILAAHLCPRRSRRTVDRQTTWNRRVAMMLPSAPHATHSGSTHGSSGVLHGKRMSMTKLPQLTDCLSFLLPQAPSYAGRRQSHPPTHAHYGSAQHSGAMPTTPRLDAPPTDIAPGVRCAPSTCAEQTHDELSTPLPSPLTSGNR